MIPHVSTQLAWKVCAQRLSEYLLLLLVTEGLLRLKKVYQNTIQNSFFDSKKSISKLCKIIDFLTVICDSRRMICLRSNGP